MGSYACGSSSNAFLLVAECQLAYGCSGPQTRILVAEERVLKLCACNISGVDVSMETAGVAVTLIDFTLSRLDTGAGAVAFCDLSADPDLFKGPRNDCQASDRLPSGPD